MTTSYALWTFPKIGAAVLVELEVLGPAPKDDAIECRPKLLGVAPLWPDTDLPRAWKKAQSFFKRGNDHPMYVKRDHIRDTKELAIKDLGLREASYLVNFCRTMTEKLRPKADWHRERLGLVTQDISRYEAACHNVRTLTEDKFTIPEA